MNQLKKSLRLISNFGIPFDLSVTTMKKVLFLLPAALIGLALTTSNFVKDWMNSEILKPASVSVAVYDLTENKFVIEENAQKVLTPASTQKLISTAIAVHSLKSDHQFETVLAHSGNVVDGVLRGEIYVFPNFNPTLGSKRFGKDLSEITSGITAWLKSNKVKVIKGIKVIDPTMKQETLPRTWIWEDIGNYYGANPCGTVFNENVVELYFESGEPGKPTKIVKTVPDLPLLSFENRVTGSEKKKDLAYCFGGPYDKGLVIEGTIPANRKNFKVKASLQRPQKGLAYLIHAALKKNGITVQGTYGAHAVPKKRFTQFATVKSASVGEIIKKTNHKSVNILAENLLQNSHMFSKSTKAQGKWATSYLKTKLGVDVTGMKLFDGSGLSHFNAVSSKQLVQVLVSMRDNEPFKNSLPIAGKSGTVKSFLKNSTLNGNVRCKSGSMTGVRSYAGYVSNTSGKKFAFAIIVNNADGTNSTVKKKIEELMNHVGGL